MGWLLVLGLKECLVECATLCVKGEVILIFLFVSFQRNWSFLVTPFLVQDCLTDEEKAKYNEEHCGARCTIENVNGILKIRFSPLANGLKYQSYEKCAKAIQVCTVCHIFIHPPDFSGNQISHPNFKKSSLSYKY